MPHVLEKTVFYFDELSDPAKEKAREWYRQSVFSDSSDWEFVYSDAEEIGEMLGIKIDHRAYNTAGGHSRFEPCIFFSGFSSQGDGACFEGRYRYAKECSKRIRQHAPEDKELHRIADALTEVQRRHFYHLTALMKHRGHYSHSGCMSVDVEDCVNMGRDIGGAEDDITQLMRDFADWIYKQLEQEYDHRSSDEVVGENIRANRYEFDEDGRRAT